MKKKTKLKNVEENMQNKLIIIILSATSSVYVHADVNC